MLETARSNIFVVRDGVVVTPPLDGRILAGTARQAVLDVLVAAGRDYTIAPVSTDDLRVADGAFVTNAVRGARWVRSVRDVVTWARPDPVTAAVLDEFWRAER